MYITDTTDNVRKIFENIEDLNDIGKIRIILYTFDLLNNNQINSKNEINPNLLDDNDDIVIFNMPMLGMSENACDIFLQYNVMIYKGLTEKNYIIIENGNIIGLEYDEKELNIINKFEKLTYNEKLDLFKELFIRYDNNTYFKANINIMTFDSRTNGFDIAKKIDKLKLK